MDPKMVPEFDPQNGVQKWHPKGGPNILLVQKRSTRNQSFILKYWVSLLSAIFGPHFGDQILAPFLGPFFNLHFWGPKMVQNFAKVFAVKAA